MLLRKVKCIFVNANKPNKDGKYGMCVLIPKSDKTALAAIQKEVKEALESKFGTESWDKRRRFKLPIRDASDSLDGYDDYMLFNANSSNEPGILNSRKQEPSNDEIRSCCFSGAEFHITVNFYPFEGDTAKGVACGLNNIMLIDGGGDGDRVGGRPDAKSDFADIEVDDSDDEIDDFDDI